MWEDGALWRAVGGREVRIAAAEGGVDVEPFDEVIGATVRKLLGAEFDLESFYAFAATQPNSEARNGDSFGVLKMTLHPGSYDWEFVPEAGSTFTDTGSASCH